MKRRLILTALCLSLALPAWAAKSKPAAPKKKPAAIVTSVNGAPQLSPDGKAFKKAKVGQALSVGTQIRTGRGKLTLLMSEGSTVRLIENTDITLKAHNPEEEKGGTVFKVVKGFGRFVVKKLAKGKHFNVETSNAVAAVKGTDWEGGVNEEGETEVSVHKTGTESSVDLTDPETGKTINLEEGEEATFDGEDFKEDTFTEEEQSQSDQQYGEVPKEPAGGDGEGQGDQGQGGQDQGAGGEAQAGEGAPQGEEGAPQGEEGAAEGGESAAEGEGAQDQEEALSEEFVEEIFADILEEAYLAEQQTQGEAASDVENMRILVDRNGYAALVGNRISRPDAYTVQKEVLAYREYGPDAGTSGAVEYTSFSAALPFDWTSVFNLGLNDPANLNGDGYPIYYRTYENFTAFNNWGDSLYVDTLFDSPHFYGSSAGPIQQGYQQYYYLNGVIAASLEDLALFDQPAYLGTYPVSTNGLTHYCSACYDDINPSVVQNGDGSVAFKYESQYAGPPYTINELFTLTFHAHDDEGLTTPISTLLGQAATQMADLRGLGGNGLNLSLTISSPTFSGDIHLIFLPGFFDGWNILHVDPSYDVCGSC